MSIAGRPPYATDEPDSFYSSAPAPQRRVRQPAPPNPNDRTSAYDVYGDYLNNDDNRQSGVGALGLGLMNMGDDSDSDSDEPYTKSTSKSTATRAAPPASSSPSKHAALAAATAKPIPRPSPPPIAAPQPGYAAPIAALNLARPEPMPTTSNSKARDLYITTSQNHNSNPFADPRPSFHSTHQHTPPSPSPSRISNEPHPLQPPTTPITPVFVTRPAPAITFASTATPRPPKAIVRGGTEDTLLPSRGEKGDDFWRRFSMVAKESNSTHPAQKTSIWLSKTQSGSTRLSRWVWITGIVILCIIGGAVGIGWYVSHNAPDHQAPKAIGGSANEAATASSSAVVSTNAHGSTVKHVSPTLTVNGRALHVEPTGVAVPVRHRRRNVNLNRTL
ncbi:hypothetical protein DXG01_003506 [Tephrocybe rancida]|nr:hypothetical protein DXG01_003506 [Tephrocybe rancida]